MTKKKKNESVVYCGPTIPGVVRRFTTFVNGVIPSELQERCDKYSVLAEFIVPVKCLSDTNRQLRDPHSATSILFKKAENIIKNGGEN